MERNIKRKIFHLCKDTGNDIEFESTDDWWFFRFSFNNYDKVCLFRAGGMCQTTNGIKGDFKFNEAVVI